jgi:trehalose/maltose hydrolase-like predicted phosphorylase
MSPWTLIESPCQFSRRRGMDALFTLGNGYLGCRGFFEEEQEGVEALGGIYVAGVFGKGALKAWKGMHRELVNTPNFLWVALRVDGEPLLARPGRISAYRRTLDMRRGVAERSFIWKGARGQRLRLRFERFMSVADLHLAGQRIEIEALDKPVEIELVAGIDARVTQLNMVTTSPLPVQPGRRHLKTLRATADELEAQVETLPNGVRIAEVQRVCVDTPAGRLDGTPAAAEGRAARAFRFRLAPGKLARMTKLAAFHTSRDGRNPMARSRRALGRAAEYEALLAAHEREWIAKWHAADIEVEGADDDQRALRFNLFHLLQACPEHDNRVSLGARGLSGEMHEGSVFWDNEIFKLPFFTFTNPAATAAMLRFRHRTLPEARRHARDLWFEGALYAWKSGDDGIEETEMGVGAYYAVHIVADIAYALRQYWEATGDDDFLFRCGVEVLVETARFWKSRSHYDPLRKTWNLLAVRGPNEYDVIVHNNLFTNVMARENLRYAAEAVDLMRRRVPAQWKKLAARLRFTDAELAAWRQLADGMVRPYDKARDLYVEDDMYLHRVPFDMKRGKPDARRVIDGTLPYEAMALYQITKQSDVVTLMNLLPWKFTPRQMRRAYDFYEPRTAHDSSLSYSPHAVMAARLGMTAPAYRYFRDCAYLDLADLQLNTISGLHFANLGGTWQAAVMGFAGLWQGDGRLHLTPRLPPAWKAMRFRLRYRGATLRVEMRGRRTTLTVEKAGSSALPLCVAGKALQLGKAGETATV